MTSAVSSNPINLEQLEEKHPLQYQKFVKLRELRAHLPLESAAQRVVEYAQDAVVFGPVDYRTHYGLDVQEIALSEKAIEWFNSPDAMTPSDKQGHPIYNYETHFGFYFIPSTYKDEKGEVRPFTLEKFLSVIQNPKVGPSSQLAYREDFSHPNLKDIQQMMKMQPNKSHWIALRTNLLFENKDNKKELMQKLNTDTGTCYELVPDARELIMILRNHYVKTYHRILLGSCSWRHFYTDVRYTKQNSKQETEEVVCYFDDPHPDDSDWEGMHYYGYVRYFYSVAALRKFENTH